MDYIEKAYNIAKAAHSGQKDKAGKDYFLHPCAVADMLNTDNEKIVALLHDVVEDTEITIDHLKKEGFEVKVIEAVEAITKRPGEKYNEYIARVKGNALATAVKIADMTHNSDITRFNNPARADYERSEKYRQRLIELKTI